VAGFKFMPIEAYELRLATRNQETIRGEFARRNFAYVFQFIALNGRALWNTAIFCLLAIVTQLTVNPLAAYALSRYRPPSTYTILLLCMCILVYLQSNVLSWMLP